MLIAKRDLTHKPDSMDSHHRLSEDLERVIMKDDTSSSVTTEEDPHLHHFKTFREKLQHHLLSHRFQVLIVALVIFDCLLVIGEILIDFRIVEKEEAHHDETSEVDFAMIHQVLRFMSITVLSVFIFETVVKIYAFRLEFFHHKMEVFDAIVVIISFALDIAFWHQHDATNGIGLIIIIRLWRVTRILNGIVMSVKIQAERKLERERLTKEALEQELAKFREYCAAQEQEIEALRALLRKHGISEIDKSDKPVLINKMDVIAEVNQINERLDKNIT